MQQVALFGITAMFMALMSVCSAMTSGVSPMYPGFGVALQQDVLAALNTGRQVEWVSPLGNMTSILDPMAVPIRFRVHPPEVVESGTAMSVKCLLDGAEIGVTDQQEFAIVMAELRVGEHNLVVTIDYANAPRYEEIIWFFVWTSQAWVNKIPATGDGLQSATAMSPSTFSITSMDRHNNRKHEGGDSYYVRLVGPTIVMGNVTDHGDGSYGVEYTPFDQGDYKLEVILTYENGAGLNDYGVGDGNDAIYWHISGSPFQVTVTANSDSGDKASTTTELCKGGEVPGRWVMKSECEPRGLDCVLRDDDDDWVWVPVGCKFRRFDSTLINECFADRGGLILSGSSQVRTLFFDWILTQGTKEVMPRKYWTDVVATDVVPPVYFHWMVPQYDNDGMLDYDDLLQTLDNFIAKHYKDDKDLISVQASLHDLHFGEMSEYAPNIERMAAYMALVPSTRTFRLGDAVHLPPGGRSIVERGLRGPRVERANAEARLAMARHNISVFDSHSITHGRPDKSRDGYHYFQAPSEESSEAGIEVCIGNSVARATAQAFMNMVCNV